MNPKLNMAATAIACLAVGIVTGRMFPAGGAAQAAAGHSANAARPGEGRTKVSTRDVPDWPAAMRPKAGRSQAGGEAPTEAGIVWIPATLLSELDSSSGLRSLGQELFGGDGKIEGLLGVTDQEKASIQTSWRDTQGKIRSLEAATMSSAQSPDGAVRITVPDLSDGLRKIGEGFGADVRKSLGDNRGDVFLAVKQMDRLFSPEIGERTYEVKAEPSGAGQWRFHIVIEDTNGRRVWVSDKIPDEIRHLTDAAKIIPSLATPSDGSGE